jgi:GT2 family glycosyltransferase
MPVHNGMPHVDASIASLCDQTFEDFELVILENGSTDGSAERLASWKSRDSRITIHTRETRMGGAASSRAAVELTSAPIVARMDADDVSHPARLERQMAVMRDRPDASLVVTLHGYLDADGRRVRGRDRWPLRNGGEPMPFAGGCLMFRRQAYDQVGGYRAVDGTWEDLDLCVRLAEAGRVLVIPEALYGCRFHVASRTASVAVSAALQSASSRDAAVAPGRPAADTRMSALLELSSMELWAGARPTHLRELRAAARTCTLPRRLVMLAWARWAQLSPASLRAGLRLRACVRDRVAGLWVSPTEPREWLPR